MLQIPNSLRNNSEPIILPLPHHSNNNNNNNNNNNIIIISKQYFCSDCEDGKLYNESEFTATIRLLYSCPICDSDLKFVPQISQTRQELELVNEINSDNIFDLFGIDEELRHEIENNNAQSSKQISQSFLDTLGKVELDKRLSLLYNIVLKYGPLIVTLVSSTFSVLPFCSLSGELILGIPIYGEKELNKDEFNGKIVILKRGITSFVSKAINAQKCGAIALIISQSVEIYPFIMSDTENELKELLTIPILMVSKKDSILIEKILSSNNLNKKKSMLGEIDCGEKCIDCAVCQEDFIEKSIVAKLPCRHCYHLDCVSLWLNSHNTCPLCRTEFESIEGIPRVIRMDRRQEEMPYNL